MERFSPGTAWKAGNWSLLCDSMEQCNVKAREGMLITTMIMGQGLPRNLPWVFIHFKGGRQEWRTGEALLLIWTFSWLLLPTQRMESEFLKGLRA